VVAGSDVAHRSRLPSPTTRAVSTAPGGQVAAARNQRPSRRA
jgi:hypothetical protein